MTDEVRPVRTTRQIADAAGCSDERALDLLARLCDCGIVQPVEDGWRATFSAWSLLPRPRREDQQA